MKPQKDNENIDVDQDQINMPDLPPTNVPRLDGCVEAPVTHVLKMPYPKWRMFLTVAILLLLNLLNFVDRVTIAVLLTDIKGHFQISNKQVGFIQTVFIVSYLVFAPITGYLGDRHNRKWIMIWGIFVWFLSVIASSIIPKGDNNYIWFLIARGMIGVGSACYSVLAPTIISDMFTSKTRSIVLMSLFLAVPFGIGLGFITATKVKEISDWQWAVRITPFVGFPCMFLMMAFAFDPERGYADRMAGATKQLERTGFLKDLWYLLRNPTYVTSTLALTAVTFCSGTLTFWIPTTVKYANCIDRGDFCHNSTELIPNTTSFTSLLNECNNSAIFYADFAYPREDTFPRVDYIFGGIVCVSGLLGITSGTIIAMLWKNGKACFWRCKTIRADAILCAMGSYLAVAPIFGGLQTIKSYPWFSWTLFFLAILFLSLNWAIFIDMLMSTVVPNRRSSAFGGLTTVSHLFGHASGPLIIGAVSDAIRNARGCHDDNAQFESLRNALYIPMGASVISAILFTITIFVVKRDVERFEDAMGKAKQSDEVKKCPPSEANVNLVNSQLNGKNMPNGQAKIDPS